MGLFSKFENKVEDTVEGAAERMGAVPLSPVQIAKKAEKQMRREKMAGAGKQYAPTLYTVLVNASDDERLFGYYPTLAGETETYLAAKAAEHGYVMDGQPLVRFIVDQGLKRGKFEVIAELVAAPLVSQLRQEEMERYGLAAPAQVAPARSHAHAPAPARGQGQAFDPFAPADDYGYAEPYADEPRTMVLGQDAEEPTPGNPRAAQLTAYLYDMTNDRAFTLTEPSMSIGRESDNDVVIPDINASRHHATVRREAHNAWVISDEGSTNGTFVNGRRIKSAPLHDGDIIIFGTTNVEFQLI